MRCHSGEICARSAPGARYALGFFGGYNSGYAASRLGIAEHFGLLVPNTKGIRDKFRREALLFLASGGRVQRESYVKSGAQRLLWLVEAEY